MFNFVVSSHFQQFQIRMSLRGFVYFIVFLPLLAFPDELQKKHQPAAKIFTYMQLSPLASLYCYCSRNAVEPVTELDTGPCKYMLVNVKSASR